MESVATATPFRISSPALTDAPPILQLWHLTSLDAPTVAVVWTLAFAHASGIQLPLWIPTVIALAAWTFYIADRLFDARTSRSPLRPRHHFHWKHRGIFVSVAVAAAVAGAALVLTNMPIAARARNSILAAAALAYFTSVHRPLQPIASRFRRRFPKELLVALIFTLACVTPIIARSTSRLTLLLPALIFVALAWLNCHAIESWESACPVSIRRLAISLMTIALVSAGGLLIFHQTRIAILLLSAASSSFFLATLDRRRNQLAPTALRVSADLVLLTPLGLFLF